METIMIRKPISNKLSIGCTLGTILLICALYGWLSYKQKLFNPTDTTLPNLTQFVEGAKFVVTPGPSGEILLWRDLKATYYRHFIGVTLGVFLSLVIGVLMGCWPIVESAFKVPIAFLAKIPPTAMIAVYFILFGTDMEMFVAMIAFGIFPALAQSVYLSVKEVSDDAIYKAYTLGASNCELIWNIILPQILPKFIESVRLATGPAMVFLIAAEWMVSDVGVGYRLRIQSRLLNMNIVYVYLIVLCLTTYAIDWSLKLLKNKMCPWNGD
jgi:NitT/TauT family transport system permease protein